MSERQQDPVVPKLVPKLVPKPRTVYRPSLARDDFIYKLFRTRNRLRLMLDAEFKPLGITDATWRVLFFLAHKGDGIMQKELANEIGIEGPSLVRLLDRLEAQQLIERRSVAHDRRVNSVHLTPAALPLIKRLEDMAAAARGRLLNEIPDADLEACVRVFDKVISALEKDM